MFDQADAEGGGCERPAIFALKGRTYKSRRLGPCCVAIVWLFARQSSPYDKSERERESDNASKAMGDRRLGVSKLYTKDSRVEAGKPPFARDACDRALGFPVQRKSTIPGCQYLMLTVTDSRVVEGGR